MPELDIQPISEFDLDASTREEIRVFLQSSFQGYFDRHAYFKQIPTLRFLARSDGVLAGHASAFHRIVAVDSRPMRIYGVADVSVAPSSRGRGVATSVLATVESHARARGIDHLVLFADREDLYRRSGYERVDCRCRWLAIDSDRSLDVREAEIRDYHMLFKPLHSGAVLPTTEVDLLGHMF